MSLYDYEKSKEIYALDVPFYAILMAAIRQADSTNLELLNMVFPTIVEEMKARYNAPGGILESDNII